ncbi:DUF2267 domain-containing protein [Tranquillimonas alkanivorans]|uniref:Uncharacterized conserved protein, DUF2267 family n=1 Tax=Tranquillimonas alkanivorans TaxID=441119 RepID=A0A1I5TAU1_9RHOB|nr:DUF2267 domain-containing protein [Tranquillimonas alkanivorans]SFP80132.1 Uncharacterized conserved protein, DUF2267 family [Tranquillimonas alkanivorans]
MSDHGLEIIDRTVNDTNHWLNELSSQLGCEKKQAYHVLRGGLHTLRDRLTVQEASHLGGQLPHLVRGIYYENWRPADAPCKVRDQEEYLVLLAERIGDDQVTEPENAARAVFGLLKRHIDPGEWTHVRGMLPAEVEAMHDAA